MCSLERKTARRGRSVVPASCAARAEEGRRAAAGRASAEGVHAHGGALAELPWTPRPHLLRAPFLIYITPGNKCGDSSCHASHSLASRHRGWSAEPGFGSAGREEARKERGVVQGW
eukprot:349850-Chlamydomonas_euryale.AAC.9